MEKNQLQNLIEKYLNGTANAFEKKQLDDWYINSNENEVNWLTDYPEEKTDVENRMRRKLQAEVLKSGKNVHPFYKRVLPKIAAVVAGLSLLSGLVGYYFLAGKQSKHTVATAIEAPLKFQENKYVLLPDSSVILLHSGSKMHYAFNGKTREVFLSGEAYFDIKHQQDHPFIVHTGGVNTVVLGTAFNIRAYPGHSITVSVTRGKVSVTQVLGKVLSVLTPNQQLVFNGDTKGFHQQNIAVKQITTWTNSDMQFEDMPFKQLAERLSRRYNVEVKFKNPGLEKCLITGRFTGTEPLEQVLKILSETMGNSYTISDRTITLDGAGC